MGNLGARCPCGHTANYHRTLIQQDAHMAGSGGRYPGECKGGTAIHCRCITSREQVIANDNPTPPTATSDPAGTSKQEASS